MIGYDNNSRAGTVAPLDFTLESIYWLQNKYFTSDSVTVTYLTWC